MSTDTTPDAAGRIHAATVAVHEAVEDQLFGISEASVIAALDIIDGHVAALDAARIAAEARADRLRKALGQADSRLIQRQADEYHRQTGRIPSGEWFRMAAGAQESNHYAVDGLEDGDLDPARRDRDADAGEGV